jgi:hypothetical protein
MTIRHEREKALERQNILYGIQELRGQLNYARMRFNEATEPELVDACVYEISALQAKYNYFLRLAREQGIAQSYAVSLAEAEQ